MAKFLTKEILTKLKKIINFNSTIMKKKNKLKKKKHIFCFDLDNTICNTIGNNYKKSIPKKKVIRLINVLFDQGHIIKIFTSRFMGRSKENISKANKRGYVFTKRQLETWGLKHNKLIMGKPSYDYIIDDKSINFNKNWVRKIKSLL